MRSKLFVPGARPELFAKALAGEADALSLDLEDSVPETGKQAARTQVAGFLRSAEAAASSKLLIVRSNAPETAHFDADLAAVVVPGLALLNIPKIESVPQLLAAVERLEAHEAANGVARPIGLLITIETAGGLHRAAALAAAHPRVVGLQLGLGDLFAPNGINRDPVNVHATLFALKMAAAEAGVFACDGAYPDVADMDGFQAEAEMAQRLGFIGKSCIHPRQVAVANATFSVPERLLDEARRIVAASAEAASHGHGAFLFEGRMIDLPFLRRAEALLASVRPAQG